MGMGKGWPGKHADHGAWHTCMRSGIRSNLDDMIWEQGILVAPEFSDVLAGGAFGLLGSRDADIARHLRDDTSDLQPHPKLSQTNLPDEDVYFD
jgi:hypothetical protein